MKSTQLRNIIREEIKTAIAEIEMGSPKVNKSLAAKGERLEDMPAYKQLMRALQMKSATDQANFVLDLLVKFNLDKSAKAKLRRYVNSPEFMKGE